MLVFDWNHQFAPSWSTLTRSVISSLPLCNWGALKTLAVSAETHLQRQSAVRNQCLQSHLIVGEFGPSPHSESGKGVSSKCDSVRESSEIHHSSTELLSHHTEKACRKCSPWASLTWTKTKKGEIIRAGIKIFLIKINVKDATQIHSDIFLTRFQWESSNVNITVALHLISVQKSCFLLISVYDSYLGSQPLLDASWPFLKRRTSKRVVSMQRLTIVTLRAHVTKPVQRAKARCKLDRFWRLASE